MGAMQRRVGPNKVGISGGVLQPFADGLKLILKETIIPLESSNWVFLAARDPVKVKLTSEYHRCSTKLS